MAEETTPQEVQLKGIGVSPGVVFGPALLLTTEEERIVEREITEAEIPREIARLEEALIATRRQLHEIQEKVAKAIGEQGASIFDAHLLVVDDRSFVEEIIRGLKTQRRNVEAVLSFVADRYARTLAALEDDYLRERAADVRDVTRRILRNLAGRSVSFLSQLDKPHIIIANDLAPSDTALLTKDKVLAFATDLGSPTSHTAIMARALAIPAVVGLHDVSVRVSTGDTVLVDGHKGLLFIHPTPERLEQYRKTAELRQSIHARVLALRYERPMTRDGFELQISANIEMPSDVDAVLDSGADGVGLFRTEYIYLSMQRLPTEEEQAAAYEEVARRVAPGPCIIRTLDLGGDKFLSHMKTPAELNPFMGWRAIRFCLAQPDLFKTQLRAILRASRYENVKLMYPMVSNVGEVRRANALLAEAKEELRRQGVPFNPDIEVGVMIEIPSAALTAHLIAPLVSFFSLGTNDLVQYTLAVDRVNERVAYLYEPTHPAIIYLIRQTIEVAHRHGIWVGICGEMAGNPIMTPLLLGLGVDELSVSPSMVPLVKDVVRRLRFAEAEALVRRVQPSVLAEEVIQACRELTARVAPDVLELVD